MSHIISDMRNIVVPGIPDSASVRKNLEAMGCLAMYMEKLDSSMCPMVFILPWINLHVKNDVVRNSIHMACHFIDQDVRRRSFTHYHTPSHMAKVTLIASILGAVHSSFLTSDDMDILLLTAAIHDFGYSLSVAQKGGGEMENLSVSLAAECGILPKEYVDRVRDLNQSTRIDLRGKVEHPVHSIQQIISDADLIPSCAINFDRYQIETGYVEKEIQAQFTHSTEMNFLKSIGELKSARGTIFHERQKSILSSLERSCMHSRS